MSEWKLKSEPKKSDEPLKPNPLVTSEVLHELDDFIYAKAAEVIKKGGDQATLLLRANVTEHTCDGTNIGQVLSLPGEISSVIMAKLITEALADEKDKTDVVITLKQGFEIKFEEGVSPPTKEELILSGMKPMDFPNKEEGIIVLMFYLGGTARVKYKIHRNPDYLARGELELFAQGEVPDDIKDEIQQKRQRRQERQQPQPAH